MLVLGWALGGQVAAPHALVGNPVGGLPLLLPHGALPRQVLRVGRRLLRVDSELVVSHQQDEEAQEDLRGQDANLRDAQSPAVAFLVPNLSVEQCPGHHKEMEAADESVEPAARLFDATETYEVGSRLQEYLEEEVRKGAVVEEEYERNHVESLLQRAEPDVAEVGVAVVGRVVAPDLVIQAAEVQGAVYSDRHQHLPHRVNAGAELLHQ